MSIGPEKSANEIEALVLKAARGGGLPLGLAEDLAMTADYLDLGSLSQCPCSGDVAARVIPTALDRVAAGDGPKAVIADGATIAAYVAAIETAQQKTLVWKRTPTGAVFERFETRPPDAHASFGRRIIPATLSAHLHDMAVKTHVPETDASRSGGAGAGLTDND